MQNFPFLSRRRRIDRLFFSILVVVALFLPTACNKGESGLFFSDPAQPIQVKNGQAFVIALPSEQVETHEWQLAQDVDPALLAAHRGQADPASLRQHPGRRAGPGILDLHAHGPRLHHHRPQLRHPRRGGGGGVCVYGGDSLNLSG